MSGRAASAEMEAFERWLAADQDNRAAFAALSDALRAVDENAEPLLAAEFEAELETAAAEAKPPPRLWIAAIAATLLLCVGVAYYADAFPARKQHFATAVGETDEVKLSDGSTIVLNTGTSIDVEIKRTKRAVNLTNGQAVFMVQHDRGRPFIVATAQAEISVTGTMFDVNVFDGNSTVSVISGVVEVKPTSGARVTVTAGDAAVVDAGGRSARLAKFDPNVALAWRTGKLRFDETPLGDVVKQLNRYFSTPIALQGDGLGALPVTGEFDIHDQASAVRAISLIFSLDSRREAGRIVLFGQAK